MRFADEPSRADDQRPETRRRVEHPGPARASPGATADADQDDGRRPPVLGHAQWLAQWRADLERKMAAAIEQAHTLHESGSGLSDDFRTPEENGTAVVENGLTALGASAGMAVRLVEGSDTLELLGAINWPPAVVEACRRIGVSATGPIADAVRTEDGVFLESRSDAVARYPELAGYLEQLGAEAIAAVPVRHLGHVNGALCLTFSTPRRFESRDRSVLTALSSRYARALYQARLYFAEREARAEADAARVEAEEASRAKSNFLAVMSHELRTPLSAIVGYTELLADGILGPVTTAQREHLGRLRAASDHLLGLIDDLLGVSRAQAGKEEVAIDRFEIADVVEQVASVAGPVAAQKHLMLRCDLPDDRLSILSDPRKVRQILLNLVSNAVKFTERGSVTVSARRSGDQVVLTVRDTGMGIRPDHLAHVFDPFWQADQRLTRTEGGAGLGLSIAQKHARLLGGNVRAESAVGQGSTFTVSLPVSAPPS